MKHACTGEANFHVNLVRLYLAPLVLNFVAAPVWGLMHQGIRLCRNSTLQTLRVVNDRSLMFFSTKYDPKRDEQVSRKESSRGEKLMSRFQNLRALVI